jgi:hypothetical protein
MWRTCNYHAQKSDLDLAVATQLRVVRFCQRVHTENMPLIGAFRNSKIRLWRCSLVLSICGEFFYRMRHEAMPTRTGNMARVSSWNDTAGRLRISSSLTKTGDHFCWLTIRS